jgi:hypothetical protein
LTWQVGRRPESEAMPLVSTNEAIDMLWGLCLHEFQQKDGESWRWFRKSTSRYSTQVEEGQ